jgi:hypothetical protein
MAATEVQPQFLPPRAVVAVNDGFAAAGGYKGAAQALAGATASEDQLRAAKAFAEAQFDLKRIRDTRLAATFWTRGWIQRS